VTYFRRGDIVTLTPRYKKKGEFWLVLTVQVQDENYECCMMLTETGAKMRVILLKSVEIVARLPAT
jgi:hypothetical protein